MPVFNPTISFTVLDQTSATFTATDWAVNPVYNTIEYSVTGAGDITGSWLATGSNVFTYVYNTTSVTWSGWGGSYVAPQISQEEADRRLAATRREQHRNAIRRKRAIGRGRRLLVSVLSDDQRRSYARTGSFVVVGQDMRRYVLRKGRTVHELDDQGRAVRSHCIHLPYSYIDEDTLIGLKLLIETDIGSFLATANTSNLTNGERHRGNIYVPDANPLRRIEMRRIAITSGPEAVNAYLARHAADSAQDFSAAMRRMGQSFERLAPALREATETLSRAADYGEYARELESQVVAEDAGLLLPLRPRQVRCAQALGHDVTIGADPVPAIEVAA